MYCINLKHRVDRWERFSSQPELERLKSLYGFERFEGINGSTLDIPQDRRISLRTRRNIKDHVRRDHEELDSAGGVGCYLSHTTVWKRFLERNESYAIIFEDDAIIPPGFTERLHAAMKDITLLPSIPDIWSFSEMHEPYFDSRGKPLPNTVSQYNYGPWTTKVCTTFTGYLVSKRGAQRLLESAFPIDMHVDMYACLASELGQILTVKHANVFTPAVAVKENDTDIRIKEACAICDVPTKYREQGMVLVSIPVLLVGVGTLAGLYYLGSRR
jgi:GR25 family glycosyltransferase involved in LPS biosynthesis